MAGKRQMFTKPMTLVGNHARETSLTSAKVLATPANANVVMIQAITQNVRYSLDGTVPSASQGFRLAAGALVTIAVGGDMTLTVIGELLGASVEYQWGKN